MPMRQQVKVMIIFYSFQNLSVCTVVTSTTEHPTCFYKALQGQSGKDLPGGAVVPTHPELSTPEVTVASYHALQQLGDADLALEYLLLLIGNQCSHGFASPREQHVCSLLTTLKSLQINSRCPKDFFKPTQNYHIDYYFYR